MTAEVPARSSLTPGKDTMRWFANQPAGNSFDQRAVSTGTDFNLQISNGIQNFQLWKQSQGGFDAPAPQAGARRCLTARPETTGEPETMILNGERAADRVDLLGPEPCHGRAANPARPKFREQMAALEFVTASASPPGGMHVKRGA